MKGKEAREMGREDGEDEIEPLVALGGKEGLDAKAGKGGRRAELVAGKVSSAAMQEEARGCTYV